MHVNAVVVISGCDHLSQSSSELHKEFRTTSCGKIVATVLEPNCQLLSLATHTSINSYVKTIWQSAHGSHLLKASEPQHKLFWVHGLQAASKGEIVAMADKNDYEKGIHPHLYF